MWVIQDGGETLRITNRLKKASRSPTCFRDSSTLCFSALSSLQSFTERSLNSVRTFLKLIVSFYRFSMLFTLFIDTQLIFDFDWEESIFNIRIEHFTAISKNSSLSFHRWNPFTFSCLFSDQVGAKRSSRRWNQSQTVDSWEERI